MQPNSPKLSRMAQPFAQDSGSDDLTPAMQIRDLTFYYGQQKAIENVSMDVYQNQVTAIIGPSGCGKSTFIKSLNRISELEGEVRVRGVVEFFGQNIYSSRVNLNRLRREIGMVFQKPNPFPKSIYDNVAYGIRVFGRTAKADLDAMVESALRGAALWDEVKDDLGKSALGLSGGQQQRLCIARALAVKPKVLLMDEPCSALDPLATLKIEDLMQSLSHELTIVIVTHNMQQASRVSNYTAFFSIDDNRVGKLVEFGSTSQIFIDPSHPRTKDYVEGRFG